MTTSPSLQRFLALVAFSEGTSTSTISRNRGYDVIVTGVDGPEVFTDYSDHPFAHRAAKEIVAPGPRFPKGLYSTASGRYQILLHIFEAYKEQLGLSDFSPASQDAIALQLIKERGSIDMILAGNIEDAITTCSNIWASLPGNRYGQGGHSMDVLLEKYGPTESPSTVA